MFRKSFFWAKLLIATVLNYSLLATIGMLLWGNSSQNYADIIYNETQEWSIKAIQDIVEVDMSGAIVGQSDTPKQVVTQPSLPIRTAAQEDKKPSQSLPIFDNFNAENDQNYTDYPCPVGYLRLAGLFYGTNPACFDQLTQGYSVGECTTGTQDYLQIPIIADQLLDTFNGSVICYLRSNYSFHDIMSQKDSNPLSQYPYCGSSKDLNKRYRPFQNGTLCLPNDLSYDSNIPPPPPPSPPKKPNSKPDPTPSKPKPTPPPKHWSIDMIYDSDLNNPIVKLYYSLSPPCINTQIPFVQRIIKISPIYREISSGCDNYYTKFHTQYYDSGYAESELNAYEVNNISSQLYQKYPGLDESQLLINFYKLYYKPYSHWAASCQSTLSSLDFQAHSESLIIPEEKVQIILIFSLIYMAIEGIMVWGLFIANRKLSANRDLQLLKCIVFGVQIMSICFLLGLAILYYELNYHIQYENLGPVQYANANLCSDGVLQIALQNYEQHYQQDLKVIRLSFFIIAALIVTHCSIIICCSDLGSMICNSHCCKRVTNCLLCGLREPKQADWEIQSDNSSNTDPNNKVDTTNITTLQSSSDIMAESQTPQAMQNSEQPIQQMQLRTQRLESNSELGEQRSVNLIEELKEDQFIISDQDLEGHIYFREQTENEHNIFNQEERDRREEYLQISIGYISEQAPDISVSIAVSELQLQLKAMPS